MLPLCGTSFLGHKSDEDDDDDGDDDDDDDDDDNDKLYL